MDNANYAPSFLPYLLSSGGLGGERFTLIDVGCSGGLDPLWRLFGGVLEAHGFDPQRGECARLQAAEALSHVHYHPYLVGLPKENPFLAKRAADEAARAPYHASPWPRFSSVAAVERHAVQAQSQSIGEDLTAETISIDDFADRRGLRDIDFVKIDTDGFDLEAALSCERSIRSRGVLGFMIESPFTGGPAPTENSLHNIDRLMRSYGFTLFALSTNRYSRRHLPARFVYRIPAQTEAGQVAWGDAVYLRDAAASGYVEFFAGDLSVPKLLKLAALFELFRLPDCAAELLLSRRERLGGAIDEERALDLLTQSLMGQPRSYREHLRLFETDLDSFFPWTSKLPRPPMGARIWVGRILARVARRLGT